MSKIINLFGGPGTGKSTLAAMVFAELKKRNQSVELVREYVKEWAWEGRNFGKYDQFYFLGKQVKKESMVYGKVDYIVTDSPLMIAGFYAKLFNKLDFVNNAALAFMKSAQEDGHEYLNFYLPRVVKYDASGRFQDEDAAKATDDALLGYLVATGAPFTEVSTDLEGRVDFILDRI